MNYFLVFVFGFVGVAGLARALEILLTGNKFVPVQFLIGILFSGLALQYLRKARAARSIGSTPPPITVRRKFRLAAVVIAIVLAIGLAAFFGKILHPSRTTTAYRPSAASDWKRRECKDLSVEAPFNFSVKRGMLNAIAKEVRDSIEYLDAFQSAGDDQQLNITLSRVGYRPDMTADLDNAAASGVRAAAGRLGDNAPNYTTENTTVSGLEARKTVYSKKLPNGTTLYMDSICVAQSNKLWQVQAIYLNASAKVDADRVLKSIEIRTNE